ncbi:YafY family protein [Cohnella sp. REN36]|uniref:helix-turn-helix transcriptional regulator n=1 Tax=Cohnella sp. REN36 TaxID=2887347 RepID=UPI001D14DB8E|nr:WYL domain-containing protein [Cohnella sp. REN36]MCC3373738.1 WYL domain-containing protein [Cohnella sp. REN36]
MSNNHRIVWIDAQIRENRYPNAVMIAEKFSISPRQAARDLEYLRDSMCAPLAYSRERKGYYYEDRSFAVAGIVMTEGQKRALAFLAEQYKRLENEHATHLARLFSRLIGDGPEVGKDPVCPFELPVFPVDRAVLGRFDLLNAAIKERRKIYITFMNEQEEEERALVSPYKMYVHRTQNYVVGYCEPAGEIRLFNLTELRGLALTDDLFDLAPLLRHAEVVPFLLNEANIAVIRFDVTPYGRLLGLQVKEVEPSVFHIRYYDTERLIAKLLPVPCRMEIISPAWLRNLVYNRAKSLQRWRLY